MKNEVGVDAGADVVEEDAFVVVDVSGEGAIDRFLDPSAKTIVGVGSSDSRFGETDELVFRIIGVGLNIRGVGLLSFGEAVPIIVVIISEGPVIE